MCRTSQSGLSHAAALLQRVCEAQEGDLQMCLSLSSKPRLVKTCAQYWGNQGIKDGSMGRTTCSAAIISR